MNVIKEKIPGLNFCEEVLNCSASLFGVDPSFFQGAPLGPTPFIPSRFFKFDPVECEWAEEFFGCAGGPEVINLVHEKCVFFFAVFLERL